jgi:hypothetical protein
MERRELNPLESARERFDYTKKERILCTVERWRERMERRELYPLDCARKWFVHTMIEQSVCKDKRETRERRYQGSAENCTHLTVPENGSSAPNVH